MEILVSFLSLFSMNFLQHVWFCISSPCINFLADTLILWKTIDSQSTCSLATEDIVGKARQQVNIFFCTIFIASVVIIISALVHNALEMYIDVCCIDII